MSTILEDIAKEVHMKYYNRGIFNKEKEEIKEICDKTGASKKEVKEVIKNIKHPIEFRDRVNASKKQKAIRQEMTYESNLNRTHESNEPKQSFWSRVIEASKTTKCPRCGSTQLAYDTKKLSVTRGVIGGLVAGTPGMVMGGLSSKKGYRVCLNCGKRWKI